MSTSTSTMPVAAMSASASARSCSSTPGSSVHAAERRDDRDALAAQVVRAEAGFPAAGLGRLDGSPRS